MFQKITGGALVAYTFVMTLIRIGGDADFVIERAQKPTEGVGGVLSYLANPQPWMLLVAMAVGFALLLWGARSAATPGKAIDKAPSTTSSKPDFRLTLPNIEIMDVRGSIGQLSGIVLDVEVWNLGEPSVITEWGLRVTPPGMGPIKAHFTMPPPVLRGGVSQTVIMTAADDLSAKTKFDPVGRAVVPGKLLFYLVAHDSLILNDKTRIELCLKDLYGAETVVSQELEKWGPIRRQR